MNLSNRLTTLESASVAPQADGAARERLLGQINETCNRIRGSSLKDSPNASVAERVAMAFERGNGEFAVSLLQSAAGRRVQP